MDDTLDDDALTALSLATDVQTIGKALLSGDLIEARFRTSEVARAAQAAGQPSVVDAAAHLADRLHPPLGLPGAGVGAAYAALAASVYVALGFDRWG
jgi:hypothetical protein